MNLNRLIILIITNVFMGNLLLLIISSNWFLSSLLLNFRLLFHFTFTVLIVLAILLFAHMVVNIQSRFAQIAWAFLLAISSVLITCWISIGYAFIGSNDFLLKLVFSFKFGGIVGLTVGALFWFPFGVINYFTLRNCSNYTSLSSNRKIKEWLAPIFIIVFSVCIIVGSFFVGSDKSFTSSPDLHNQRKLSDKASLIFTSNAVNCTSNKDVGIHDILFDEGRFAAMFPRLSFFDVKKNREELEVYFESKDDAFRQFIEISYGGEKTVIDTYINAKDYSGVVVGDILYLSWLLGPKKGHLLPESNGKIYLMAFDLDSRKELYRRVIFSGSNEITDTSLSYMPENEHLILTHEILNRPQIICIGSIPITAIKDNLDVNFNPIEIEVNNVYSQHSLPRLFTSSGQLYYFSRIDVNSFMILRISDQCVVDKKFLLSPGKNKASIISNETDGNLRITELGSNQCWIVPIEKLLFF